MIASLTRLPWVHKATVAAKGLLLPLRIESILRRRRSPYIVQIGSNDGKTGDPIYSLITRNRSWCALFVEPVGYLFERLKTNYGSEERFRFENVAIAQEVGTLSFFHIDPQARANYPELPEWVEQLGSFDPSALRSSFDGVLLPYIRELQVACAPLDVVLRRNDVESIDMLHIDTEGYDWEVLKQFDFSKFKPAIVLFEHKHLSENTRNEARRHMEIQGYRLEQWGGDFLCLLQRNEN